MAVNNDRYKLELRATIVESDNNFPSIPDHTQPTMAAPTAAGTVVPALADRAIKNTVVLFDVDGTLTPARLVQLP